MNQDCALLLCAGGNFLDISDLTKVVLYKLVVHMGALEGFILTAVESENINCHEVTNNYQFTQFSSIRKTNLDESWTD